MGHIQHKNSLGQNIPSVSEIPAIFAKNMSGFEDWICKGLGAHLCCTKAKREYYSEAAKLGNDVHALREAFLKGEVFSEGVPEYQARVFDPVAKFYKDAGYKPLQIRLSEGDYVQGTELKMTGNAFGGSLDGCGTFSIPFWETQRKTFWEGGEFTDLPTTESIWIDDLKIKSKLDVLHPLQLYGYSLLLKELYNIEARYGLIIRREKKLEKRPELQLRGYYLPAYKKYWEASMLMYGFLNA